MDRMEACGASDLGSIPSRPIKLIYHVTNNYVWDRMSYCPGSNRPPEYSTRAIKRTRHIKRTVGIGTENQLRRIVKEEFSMDYDKLKSDYIERRRNGINRLCTSLYADGINSISILFEEKTATLIYANGKRPVFTISLT